MESSEYDTIRRVENSHWWYQGLWELTLGWLRRYLPPRPGLRILDAGCGTGGLLGLLEGPYPGAVGVDLSPDALRHCRARGGLRAGRASVEVLPFRDRAFDAVVSNDVLYHRTAHEAPALAEFRRVLKPGGILLMNLPAHESLRGTHDLVIHTRRRFTRPDVASLLEGAGLPPTRITYRNSILFPIAWAVRKLRKPAPGEVPQHSDVVLPSPAVNAVLLGILRGENRLLELGDLPFGLSLFCLARRPS